VVAAIFAILVLRIDNHEQLIPDILLPRLCKAYYGHFPASAAVKSAPIAAVLWWFRELFCRNCAS